MADSLLSVGLDVGTTTTQLILSRLSVQNKASGFAVPEMEIADRQVIYRSPVHFTPLSAYSLVDGEAIRQLVTREYEKAGIDRQDVDTGAIIITGETSRKENAAAVLSALSGFAGDFVAATAGPDLESVLAAKGAGATTFSEQSGKTVLHMDIGGGTSNLALIENGQIIRTGCLNVGGRLVKLEGGRITYVSPVLEGLTDLRVGDQPTEQQLDKLAALLASALEMAAGLRPETSLLQQLMTQEAEESWQIPQPGAVISFSGGVADCIRGGTPGQFGDIGVQLGRAIRQSLLCSAEYMLGQETIRATVIGAGSHSARLSGSTVFYRDMALPLKNLPVVSFTAGEQTRQDLDTIIARRMGQQDADKVVLAMPGFPAASYAQVTELAEKLIRGTKGKPVLVCLEADMAKALGQRLCLQLPAGMPCLCIDRIRLTDSSFLDIGNPIGPALPVVVKTLVLERSKK